MDQSKTNVPNLRRISKSTANLQRLRNHLVGAIIHSGLCPMGKAYFGFFDMYQYKHDSNLTMNILCVLLEVFNERFGLPPVLNVQLDNCWRENKNKYVFTLFLLLVEWSVFDKVSFPWYYLVMCLKTILAMVNDKTQNTVVGAHHGGPMQINTSPDVII